MVGQTHNYNDSLSRMRKWNAKQRDEAVRLRPWQYLQLRWHVLFTRLVAHHFVPCLHVPTSLSTAIPFAKAVGFRRKCFDLSMGFTMVHSTFLIWMIIFVDFISASLLHAELQSNCILPARPARPAVLWRNPAGITRGMLPSGLAKPWQLNGPSDSSHRWSVEPTSSQLLRIYPLGFGFRMFSLQIKQNFILKST